MKIIESGKISRIYDDDIAVHDAFPPKTYNVSYSKLMGFYLEERPDMTITEKVYGKHEAKSDKVLNSFGKFERNLGVILSGDKGIGKTLFAKLLCIKSQRAGLPIFVVDSYIPGIARFIESIDQEALVFFDEFDKTYNKNIETGENSADPQSTLLSMFDGTSGGKKLFVITCNNDRDLSDYYVNRPGRFHYHFRFSTPEDGEIVEYLRDNLDPEYYGEIEGVVKFAHGVGLNFDCLRAIAFELNSGITFAEAISDINIVKERCPEYDLSLIYPDGTTFSANSISVNLYEDEEDYTGLRDKKFLRYSLDVWYSTRSIVYDGLTGETYIPGDDVRVDWNLDDGREFEAYGYLKDITPIKLLFRRKISKDIHYAV